MQKWSERQFARKIQTNFPLWFHSCHAKAAFVRRSSHPTILFTYSFVSLSFHPMENDVPSARHRNDEKKLNHNSHLTKKKPIAWTINSFRFLTTKKLSEKSCEKGLSFLQIKIFRNLSSSCHRLHNAWWLGWCANSLNRSMPAPYFIVNSEQKTKNATRNWRSSTFVPFMELKLSAIPCWTSNIHFLEKRT